MKTIQPYKHDCDRCVWVGWIKSGEKFGNIYLCKGKFMEVIIRYSDEPSDYSCWSVNLDSDPKPHAIAIMEQQDGAK